MATSSVSRPDGPRKLGEERVGRLILDGDVILAADGPTMNERRKLASFGVISVALALNAQDRLVGDVQLALEGIPVEEDREAFLEEACEAAVGSRPQGRRQRGEVARGGPPRGAPLRHRMDRQEAGGGRAARPGVTG